MKKGRDGGNKKSDRGRSRERERKRERERERERDPNPERTQRKMRKWNEM